MAPRWREDLLVRVVSFLGFLALLEWGAPFPVFLLFFALSCAAFVAMWW